MIIYSCVGMSKLYMVRDPCMTVMAFDIHYIMLGCFTYLTFPVDLCILSHDGLIQVMTQDIFHSVGIKGISFIM